MMYLIMKCDQLADQYECDVDRTPIALTSDWQTWVKENKPDYLFEVWEYDINNQFTCIKDYEDPMEQGMALYYWAPDEYIHWDSPHVVVKFPNYNRESPIPDIVIKRISTNTEKSEVYNRLESRGFIKWYDNEDNYYVYGEYEDDNYLTGF